MDSGAGPVGPSVVFEDVKRVKASSFVLWKRHDMDLSWDGYLVCVNRVSLRYSMIEQRDIG